MILYATTILLSAFLLFLVQPIIAKQILPWFGGSAGVWSACLVFFQLLLLGGYAYAHWLGTRRAAGSIRQHTRQQSMIHIVLLWLSLAALPIIPSETWKPVGEAEPLWRILGLLAVTIGLPYFMLSATGPLMQKWLARRTGASRKVYRLFALSNFGSLLGLLAYPFAVEPFATAHMQSWVWSAAYAVFVLACTACAWQARDADPETMEPIQAHASAGESQPPGLMHWCFWLSCAALGSILLLAITSHITQNIASIPFLWVLPLSLYLFSFVVCFEGRGGQGWYERRWWLLPVLALTVGMAWGLGANNGVLDLRDALPLYGAGLFLACVFCHGELAASKPAPEYLTQFYLALSAGGALGGLLVALIAPRWFDHYWEMPLALIALADLALMLCLRAVLAGRWQATQRGTLAWRYSATLLALLALIGTSWFAWDYYHFIARDTRVMSRNFYGSLRVRETEAGPDQVRRLLHGVILHGEQFTDPARRMTPSTYYGPTSGIGLAIQMIRPSSAGHRIPLRVGSIGLGTGTLAAYGQPGDVYRIYEINPDVQQLAATEFSYLKHSRARIETILGDARLSLEREAAAGVFTDLARRYDVLSVDAFSSDSIPVHLITREALAVYARAIKPDGVMAFHVSNRFLNLEPVVQQLAAEAGYTALEIHDEPEDEHSYSSSTWVLVTRNQAFLRHEEIAGAGQAIKPVPGLQVWTDQFNNLFQILK